MSKTNMAQTTFTKGIYEFEDPSGSLVAAKVPANGTVDLYTGTVVIVKPNQSALFIYKGQVADLMKSGTFQIMTDNLPVLTKLASWKFGFNSPLRCQLVFFGHQQFTSRRWGTSSPVLIKFENFDSLIPIRAFGNYNIKLDDPRKFFTTLFGTRSLYSISDLEELVQSHITELLPTVLQTIKRIEMLSSSYAMISKTVEQQLNKALSEFGFSVSHLKVLSALPSKEIIDALEAKTAIQAIGSQKEYLLYKAANSLSDASSSQGAGQDPIQVMMGLMLSKGFMGHDYHKKEHENALPARSFGKCEECNASVDKAANFCPSCGRKL